MNRALMLLTTILAFSTLGCSTPRHRESEAKSTAYLAGYAMGIRVVVDEETEKIDNPWEPSKQFQEKENE